MVVAAVADAVGVPETGGREPAGDAARARWPTRRAAGRHRQLRARPGRRATLRRADADACPDRARPGHEPDPADAAVRAWCSPCPGCRSAADPTARAPRRRRGGAVHRADAAAGAAATGTAGRAGHGRARSAGRSTAWRWPSSWPRPGFPASGSTASSRALGAQLPLLDRRPRAEDRHRSLRAAIDWSYALLDADERADAACRGGVRLAVRPDALAAVTGPPAGGDRSPRSAASSTGTSSP